VKTWTAVFVIAAFAGCVTSACAATAARKLVRETATTTSTSGEHITYEVGTLFVPENRSNPNSRLIGVGYARLPSTSRRPSPPIFVLPGGPGESIISALSGDDRISRERRDLFLKYRQAGDVVIMDQRGFSPRGELIEVPTVGQSLPKNRPVEIADVVAAEVDRARAAITANAGRDLSGYTIVACADDLDELRQALGYRQVSLMGQSFGSQWSFAVMRLHPEIVARALLSGVEPLSDTYDMPSLVFAALQRVAWAADSDPQLAPYRPAGGLLAAMKSVRDRLAEAPVTVVGSTDQGEGAQPVVLGLGEFQQALLSPPQDLPALILSAYAGDYRRLADHVLRARAPENEGVIGPLIDTSLGVSPQRALQLKTDPALIYLGAWDFAAYMAAAEILPTPDVGEELRRPQPSSIPVVFLQGDWDVSTPIENMFSMLPYFPNSHALIIHGGGHGGRVPLFAQRPDILNGVLDFLRQGDMSTLPTEATLDLPSFTRPDAPLH
jgi:pimeloyl-ACP methyl ester carboxylesterase